MSVTIDISLLADLITIGLVIFPLLRKIYKKIIHKIAIDIAANVKRLKKEKKSKSTEKADHANRKGG